MTFYFFVVDREKKLVVKILVTAGGAWGLFLTPLGIDGRCLRRSLRSRTNPIDPYIAIVERGEKRGVGKSMGAEW